ncbi:mechanosensitive ion channel family protein [Nonlabens ponticola]|uniref:Mechanosensitive ion channel n=1 Tax=Nonlabens ponticola TaxID=2496866 RepID=A0A3S9MXM9_9FLAO|nr:mechanosensitive ion channel domain-containing protein [Nonlabens ponticola]AZQ43950.1 mechanosensitive ion channel [Nonlabens ponticola]
MVIRIQILVFLITLGGVFSSAQQDSTQLKNPKKEIRFPLENDTIPENGSYPPSPLGEYNKAYYAMDEFNTNIGMPPTDINLQTPQSVLEHFVKESRSENFKSAAYALNLNLFPNDVTIDEAAELAEKFYFVLNKKLAIDWQSLPDRPDGQVDITTNTNKSVAGVPRRSIDFGKLDLDGREVVLRVQRVKVKDGGPFWVISANTVENIEPLYVLYGPRKLDRMMPKWSRANVLGVPWWKLIGTFVLLVLSIVAGKLASATVEKIFKNSNRRWMNMIAHKLASPSGFAAGVLVFYLTLENLVSFGGPFARFIYSVLLIALIGSIGWFIMRVVNGLMIYFAERSLGDDTLEENPEYRKMMTYISVARRLITLIIIFIGLSIIASQFPSLERLGISLMASAGLVSIVLGVAAQDTLGNILAGIQIALTSPAKIGDTILIEDELGIVEDITFTYVVVRTWDQKRLVIPCKEVVSQMFENWSMTNSHITKPIELYVDYTTDVQMIRDKFDELLRESEDWDEKNDPVVEVVDMTEKSMKIRALCSAKNPAVAWDLHCKLKEELVAYIAQLEKGKYLTKVREIDTVHQEEE